MTQPFPRPFSARPSRHVAWLIASALCAAASHPAQAARELFAQAEPSPALQTAALFAAALFDGLVIGHGAAQLFDDAPGQPRVVVREQAFAAACKA